MYLTGSIASSTFLVYSISMAPKQTDPQFKLRMTPEIKDAIEAAAKANNRSMNAEILSRLERSFKKSDLSKTVTELETIIEALNAALADELELMKKRYSKGNIDVSLKEYLK